MPDTRMLIALIVLAFLAVIGIGAALSLRRGQRAERHRMRRKMLAVHDQYRLVEEALRAAEASRVQLREEWRRSEQARRQLEAEVERLNAERRHSHEQSLSEVDAGRRRADEVKPEEGLDTPTAEDRPPDGETRARLSAGESSSLASGPEQERPAETQESRLPPDPAERSPDEAAAEERPQRTGPSVFRKPPRRPQREHNPSPPRP
jgi:hypothetical protein